MAGDAQEVRPGPEGACGPAGSRDRKPIVEVARDLGINDGTVGNWAKPAEQTMRAAMGCYLPRTAPTAGESQPVTGTHAGRSAVLPA
jgi:hypothetical protein